MKVCLKVLFLSSLLIITIISCGKKHDSNTPGTLSFVNSPIIIGDLDWSDVTDLDDHDFVRINSHSIGDVIIPKMRSRCTGFMVATNIVMTNHHCIPTSMYAEDVKVRFRHEKGVASDDMLEYVCDEFIGNNQALDYALLKCKGNPSALINRVTLASEPIAVSNELYVVQQNCDYYSDRSCDFSKKVSFGRAIKIGDEITHNADTLGGSSGSPVFSSERNIVIGLHHAGYGNNGMGRGVENYAVRMDKIVTHLLENFSIIDFLIDEDSSTPGDKGGCGPAGNSCNVTEFPFYKDDLKVEEGEIDLFIIPETTGSTKIEIKFNHGGGDLDMKLFNSSMEQIGRSDSTTDREVIDIESLESGTVLKVYGYKGAVNSYKITITVELSIDGDNSSFALASPVEVPFRSDDFEISSPKKSSFFKVSVSNRGKVVIRIEFDHDIGDLDLFIYDENKKELERSNGISSSEEINKILLPGVYFVEIRGYRGAIGDYSLSIN